MESNSRENITSGNISERVGSPVMKKLSTKPSAKKNMSLVLGVLAVIIAGITTGWFLSGGKTSSNTQDSESGTARGVEVSETEAGFADESAFTEEQSPEGILLEGGIEGEGTHYLDRGLGKDKYVYLTSTVIDLQSFVGKKVKVWGETLSGLHAGWLMDVGKVKVID